MSNIYLVTVSDKPNDTSWKWAFTKLPTKFDIKNAVNLFLSQWEHDPDVYVHYSSWHDARWLELNEIPFNATAFGQPLGPDVYVKTEVIEVIQN